MESHLYLAHHGIKGMKWGVRRYRNADGSLTPAGRKRYGVGAQKPSSKFGGKAKTDPRKSIVSGGQDVVRGVQKIRESRSSQPRNRYNHRPNLTQEEMDRMSDKELRDLVNRMNLEQQYSQLTQDNVARSRVDKGLDYADAVLTIAGGALSAWAAWQFISK